MGKTYLIFDEHAIECQFNDNAALELFEFLFGDLLSDSNPGLPIVGQFFLLFQEGSWKLLKSDHGLLKAEANLHDLASALLNQAISLFSTTSSGRVTLHAGLVSDQFGSILLPGKPGSGKSNASLWLSHLGLSYHTDEFVTINPADLSLSAFTRPFTVRPNALALIQKTIPLPASNEPSHALHRIILAKYTGYISHRLINPNFTYSIPPLKSIVFPVYTQSERNQLTEISKARVGMELLGSRFNSATLEDHGFKTITALVKKAPCYLMVYNNFDRIEELLGDLIQRPI